MSNPRHGGIHVASYKSFLKGKTVVLVGPANTIRGKKLGEFIDSHDVVVRLNHAWPLPEEAKEDIGSRTDIIYHNLNPLRAPRRKHLRQMHEAGVKWIVSTHPRNRKHKRRARPIHFQKRVNKRLIPFTTVGLRFRLKMRNRCGPTNTGVLAMAHLLRFKIKSLYVTGFSFFTTKYEQYPGYKKIKPKMAFRWHNQRKHKRFVIRLLARDKRLTVDPIMTRILMRFRWKSRPSTRALRPLTRLRVIQGRRRYARYGRRRYRIRRYGRTAAIGRRYRTRSLRRFGARSLGRRPRARPLGRRLRRRARTA